MAAKKNVTVIMSEPQEKKSVTRYDCDEDGAAMTTAYISKDALKKIGNPSKVKLTIEAA